jgi:alpha-1,2-glucosyltransferase
VAKLFHILIGCDTNALRLLNVLALSLICPLSFGILRTIRSKSPISREMPTRVKADTGSPKENDPTVILDAYTALNIALFPPLFFFSALFYTDVMSTLVVLLGYSAFVKQNTIHSGLSEMSNAVILGVAALLFRQTNIFWVAVFPAGLAIIDALKADALPPKSPKGRAFGDIIQDSWDNGAVHDCSVQDAELQGISTIRISNTELLLTVARLCSFTPHCRDCSVKEAILGCESRFSLPYRPRPFCWLRCLERKCCPW